VEGHIETRRALKKNCLGLKKKISGGKEIDRFMAKVEKMGTRE